MAARFGRLTVQALVHERYSRSSWTPVNHLKSVYSQLFLILIYFLGRVGKADFSRTESAHFCSCAQFGFRVILVHCIGQLIGICY